jgi:peptidyl-prolyl cis-trans isomerase C
MRLFTYFFWFWSQTWASQWLGLGRCCALAGILGLSCWAGAFADDQPAPKSSTVKTRVGLKANAAKPPVAESAATAESAAADSATKTSAKRDAAAQVNSDYVSRRDLERAVERLVAGRAISPQELNQIHAEVLAQLIDQQLVEQSIHANPNSVSNEEVNLAEKQVRLQVEQQKGTWEAFLAKRGQSEEEYRKGLAWRFVWERYCKGALTDTELESYFKDHHTEFDGTQLHVSHVLLRPVGDDPAAKEKLVAEAAALREQIVGGQLTFADAAKQHSAGPSSARGGDLGLIGRAGPMVESFTTAAFALKVGEISPPVTTPFGVHLIQVTEIVPGAKKWTDVRDQIRAPAAARVYAKLADSARKTAKIRFAPGVPHFRPGTRELE